MERKKSERYSREFRQQTVERMIACDNITRLSLEIGVVRHLLYNWRDRLEDASLPTGRSREFILRKQILALKRVLANKTWKWIFSAVPCNEEGLGVGRGLPLAARYLQRNKSEDAIARWPECRVNVPIGAGEPVGILSILGRWVAS